MHYVDFIIRDCGSRGFLPLIEGNFNGKSFRLYHGEHKATREGALRRLNEVWEEKTTPLVAQWQDNISSFGGR
ncbi:MAG: hypothetical protein MN733_32720 [Nitrososphaera sp.]|nr:hypothetical protein [Nitrososphaera sp.]